MERQQRRLLAAVQAVHELLGIDESPLRFLDGVCRHLTRINMMPALWDGTVDPIDPLVIPALMRYARDTYGHPPK